MVETVVYCRRVDVSRRILPECLVSLERQRKVWSGCEVAVSKFNEAVKEKRAEG